METLRAFLYSIGIFVSLAVIAILVAAIMKLMYIIVHRDNKKKESGAESGPSDLTSKGKVGQL
jgi:hypothetical protein